MTADTVQPMPTPASADPTDMPLAGWGDPTKRKGLPPEAVDWLAARVGRGMTSTPVDLAHVVVPASRLSAGDVSALEAVCETRTDDATRALHAAGRSYQDLVTLRGGAFPAPDAVLLPADGEEVARLLILCVELAIAVVPFGGGTSVVGGVAPLAGGFRAVVALDLRRLDRLVSLSSDDLTAVLEPGLRGPAAEALLNEQGFTLGHFPQSYECATIGGYAATRSAGQASTGNGRFDANVLGMTVQTPAGPLVLGRGAATAAGPGLLQLMVGSEGAFGVITSVTMRIKPLPAVKKYDAYLVRSWADGIAQLRALEQSGVVPTVARLSDLEETQVSMQLSAPKAVRRLARDRCLMVLGWEGSAASVRSRRRAASVKGIRLPGAGDTWEHGRYSGPYLRDDLMDNGFLVETLETSAPWSHLLTVHAEVRAALTAALGRCVVMCHVSHLYPQGASLYFTAFAGAAEDPLAQWQVAKEAACEALIRTGATITHHHAVGADHRRWMTDEIGPLGVEVLRAVKERLDPTGILNPGKLIPGE